MYAEERQQAIASLVISQGRASVAELAQAYDVTTETVRRDLAVLDRAGRACAGCTAAPSPSAPCTSSSRASASARPPAPNTRTPSPRPPPSSFRSAAPACCSTRAPRPPDRGRAADRPRARRRDQLGAHRRTAGRRCRRSRCNCSADGSAGLTQAAVGEQALRVLDTLRVDIAFIGTNGISVRHGLSTPDSDEAAVKRAMVASANYVVVAADSSKVGREDFVSFAPISSVDTLITDAEISDADRAQLDRRRASRSVGVRMIVTVTPNPSIDRTVTLAHAADPRRGAPGHLGHHRARRQGRQRRARADAGRRSTRSRVLPASGTDPMVTALAGQRRAVPLRAGRRRRCGPTSPSPKSTAPQRSSTSPARHLDAAAHGRAHPRRRRPRRTRRVGGAVRLAAARRARHTGTPTSSRSWRRTPCQVAVDTSDATARGPGRPASTAPHPTSSSPTPRSSPASSATRRRRWKPLWPRAIRSRWCRRRSQLVDRGVARGAGHARRGGRGAGRPDRQLAGHPAAHRRRAAPSARATPRWPATSAPMSAAPTRRSGCRWPSPTAAPRPRCRAPRCPPPPQIDLECRSGAARSTPAAIRQP